MATDVDNDIEISDEEKVKIVCEFIKHCPPGEFTSVFNDVKVLLNNVSLLKDAINISVPQYNEDQFISVPIEGSKHEVLITEFNDLGGGRFYDPRTKQSFHFDHIKHQASAYQMWPCDIKAESWRYALEEHITAYLFDHYKMQDFSSAACSVFGSTNADGNVQLTACIESHQYQPKNFWNGKWRSQWQIILGPLGGTVTIQGVIKVHVHYYEDGNVQLVSAKEVKESIPMLSEEDHLAKEIVHFISENEELYQTSVSENYQTMSDTTFKALRRQLPVTRTKIDWAKLVSYSIAKELKSQS